MQFEESEARIQFEQEEARIRRSPLKEKHVLLFRELRDWLLIEGLLERFSFPTGDTRLSLEAMIHLDAASVGLFSLQFTGEYNDEGVLAKFNTYSPASTIFLRCHTNDMEVLRFFIKRIMRMEAGVDV